MKPFFTYYGGKFRAAPHYPAPAYGTIIEPFAGAAGYALRYPTHEVILADLDPTITSLWRYLINADPQRILSLPDVPENTSVTNIPNLEPAERSLIGFWLNKGSASPSLRPSAWMRGGLRPNSFWGAAIRSRISSQVAQIRHWQVVDCSYEEIQNRRATWFVDPPYRDAGVHYRRGSKEIDYEHLGRWCSERQGQTIACENEGATWLPFSAFRSIKANESRNGGKRSVEVMWHQNDFKYPWEK